MTTPSVVLNSGGKKKRKRKKINYLNFRWGVLAPGSAHARPSAQPPINMSRNFPAHMSAESPRCHSSLVLYANLHTAFETVEVFTQAGKITQFNLTRDPT